MYITAYLRSCGRSDVTVSIFHIIVSLLAGGENYHACNFEKQCKQTLQHAIVSPNKLIGITGITDTIPDMIVFW